MISAEENQLLTQTNANTPCGELLRRYWQPVALSEELPKDGAPLKVKILGEELVLFRDDQGRLGLIGLHCAHRGTDLSYGRIEDGGLRCLYHGWLYDVCGRVIDQPGELAGGVHKQAIRHLAYPCQEMGGIILTYMGPGDPPLLPDYEFLTVPGEYRTATKILEACNYLQGNEGNIDPVHLSFLHQCLDEAQIARRRTVPGSEASDNTLLGEDIAPTIEVEVTDYGLRIYTLRGAGRDKRYLRVTNFVMPNLSVFGGSTAGAGYSIHWHVPIDDTHHWKYTLAFSRDKSLDDFLRNRNRAELTADYRLTRNAANRYLQDRDSMKTQTFTGMGLNFQAHDAFATESQGPVQDRTEEHPVTSDKAIIAARKLLLNAMKNAQDGRDPQHVIRDPNANRLLHLQAMSEVVPASVDVKQHVQERIAQVQRAYNK
ncbi:MAG TPA: Rieske 2Fe-2S domain-containing protein [Candidatus Binatia bacterium]|jgi:phenylpropionate dioxygenase-like ring-hydroxylating dioxygenase large terminal subunit